MKIHFVRLFKCVFVVTALLSLIDAVCVGFMHGWSISVLAASAHFSEKIGLLGDPLSFAIFSMVALIVFAYLNGDLWWDIFKMMIIIFSLVCIGLTFYDGGDTALYLGASGAAVIIAVLSPLMLIAAIIWSIMRMVRRYRMKAAAHKQVQIAVM